MKTQQQIEEMIRVLSNIIKLQKDQEKYFLKRNDLDNAITARNKIINLEAEIRLLEWVLK